MNIKKKKFNKERRHKRVRAKIIGSAEIPRLCVFRSNQHIYAQLINDQVGKTLTSARDLEIKKITLKNDLSGKKAKSFNVGELIAEKAVKLKIKKIVFDRGGYKYHGRVKALAEGARSKGLVF